MTPHSSARADDVRAGHVVCLPEHIRFHPGWVTVTRVFEARNTLTNEVGITFDTNCGSVWLHPDEWVRIRREEVA